MPRRTGKNLIDGSATEFPPYYWNVFALEAFRCQIESDQPGAETLAKAVMTALKLDQAKRDAENAAKGVTDPPSQPVGAFQLAYIYDFYLRLAQARAAHSDPR